ncbi:MAG: diacylglycerol kinase [Flavobacteriales bacterium CG_4_9_14_3_um_filter_32_8]|nr:MAG: diacylglycerol kinase [Flavobacteriales bacterium CG_4_9_14_3_um_filter_32_8]
MLLQFKKKILFIINPISGIGKQKVVEHLIEYYLDKKQFDVDINYTQRHKHGEEISAENAGKYDIIVAVGGDGSVNQIGKQLIHTKTTLAIIPTGSGNGLARHLKIPLKIKKALLLINKGNTKLIDTVKINEAYFIGTAGVGFDAYISWKFSEAKKRGFWTYLKIALTGFLKYQPTNYIIHYDGKEKIIKKGWLVTFTNSSQYGNNVFISPNAIIDDGLIRLMIIQKFPLIYFPIFVVYFLLKQIHQFKFTTEIVSRKITLINPNIKIHIDGEPIIMGNKIEVEAMPQSLKVIVP